MFQVRIHGRGGQGVVTAADLLDATSLEISFPSLTIPGVGAFDFTDLAEITASDLGVFLSDLGRWVPEIGRGLELPLIDQNIASIFSDDFSSQLEGLVAAVQNADGEWAFDTVQEMIDLIRSVEKDQPLNTIQNVAEATATAVLGRMAAYTGKMVRWRDLMVDQKSPFYNLQVGPDPRDFERGLVQMPPEDVLPLPGDGGPIRDRAAPAA